MSSVFNIDLIGTILIIMSYMRTRKRYSMSHHFFCGLQFIVPPTLSELERVKDPPKAKRAKTPPKQKSVYDKLELLNIQMLRLNASYIMGEASFITGQIFWLPFDMMVSAGICSVILLSWSEFYSCLKGTYTERFWLPLIAVGTLLLSICNCVVTMRYDISCRPFSKLATVFGVLVSTSVFLIEVLPVSFSAMQLFALGSFDLSTAFAAKPFQMLAGVPISVSSKVSMIVAQIGYSVLLGLLASSLVPAGLRFSHGLLILTGGTVTEKAQTLVRCRLWLEVYLPALVLGNIWVTPVDAVGRRLIGVLLLVLVRLSNIRVLLQCVADRGSSELALGLSAGDAGLQRLPVVLRNRVGSFVSAATQLLAPVTMLAAAIVLLYHHSASGLEPITGLSLWLNRHFGRGFVDRTPVAPVVGCVSFRELFRTPPSLSLLKNLLVCLKSARLPSSVLCSLANVVITGYCLFWPFVVAVCVVHWRLNPYEFRLSSF